MTRKKRPWLMCGSLLAVLIGILFVPIWRHRQGTLRRQALFDAIRANDAPRVLDLLHAGADPNARLPSPRPLTLQDNIDVLLHPSQYYSDNHDGQTPLLAALNTEDHSIPGQTMNRYNPHPDPVIIRALLDAGADPNSNDRTMTAPITFAVYTGRIDVVDLLRKHGAKEYVCDLCGTKDDQSEPASLGKLLLVAASQGNVEMMRYLLAQGADIHALNYDGKTALICTVCYARRPEPVKLLIEHHVPLNVKDRSGRTALSYARKPSRFFSPAQTRHLPEVIALLQQAGAK